VGIGSRWWLKVAATTKNSSYQGLKIGWPAMDGGEEEERKPCLCGGKMLG